MSKNTLPLNATIKIIIPINVGMANNTKLEKSGFRKNTRNAKKAVPNRIENTFPNGSSGFCVDTEGLK